MTRMTAQTRDLVAAMRRADSVPCECGLCGREMGDDRHSPFATVCRQCADDLEAEELAAHVRICEAWYEGE